MKKYIGQRASGKTYQLIQEARKNENGIVITVDKHQANVLKFEYPDMEDRIYSFDDYMMALVVTGDFKNKEDREQYELYIDDFDEIAANYIPGTVMAGTISVDGNVFMFSKGR